MSSFLSKPAVLSSLSWAVGVGGGVDGGCGSDGEVDGRGQGQGVGGRCRGRCRGGQEAGGRGLVSSVFSLALRGLV